MKITCTYQLWQRCCLWIVWTGLLLSGSHAAFALQTIQARKSEPGPATQASPLKEQKRLSLYLHNISLVQALEEIAQQYQTGLAINPALVPDKKINLKLSAVTVEEALQAVLANTRIEGFVSTAGNITLREKPAATQTKDILTGKVTDATTGEALPGVNIIIKGTNTGTTTNANGEYSLNVPDAASILVFSFISYTTEEVPVNGRTTIDITLAPDVKSLREVVVVGYGSQQRSEIVGAVATASTKEIRSRNYNNAAEVLQGTVPGITVISNGGDPTAQPTINIRGIGSINNENPLLVVDGVIYNGQFSSISPGDIESISVLKDASAAIYGARASGGVVLITTKKGANGKFKVNLNYQQGYQQVAKKLKALNAGEFADLMNRLSAEAGEKPNPAYDEATHSVARTTKTNWMDEIFQTGKIYNMDASISGGSEKSTFFLSGGYRKNEGVLLNTYSDRFTTRLNSSHQLLKRLRIGENLSYSITNGQGANTTSAYTGPILTAIFYPPNATIYKEDGSGKFGGVPEQYPSAYGDVINPVAYLKRLDSNNPVTNLFANPYLEWEIIDGLRFRSNWGYTRRVSNTKQFNTKITEPGKIFDFNELIQGNSTFQSLLNEQTLQFTRTLGQKHNLDVLIGHTYETWKSESFRVTATGFDNEDPNQRFLSNSRRPIDLGKYDGGASETNLESYIGRFNYNFSGKYLFTAIIRRDGTSKLLSNQRWEWYPSVSVGWLLSNEPFLQNVVLLNTLKVRASWGRIGNLGVLGDYEFSVPLTTTQSLIGQTPVINPGLAENKLSNPNLKWESSQQKNVGLDVGFLNDAITGSVDVFVKNNTQMLLKEILPGVAGAPDNRVVNAGNMENRGIELGLTYNKTVGDLQFSVSGNAAYVKNKMKSLLYESVEPDNAPRVRSLPRANINKVGAPFAAFYGFRTAGIFQSDDEAKAYVNANGDRLQPNATAGDFRFTDTNLDGRLSDDDRVILGSVFPKWTFGLNSNFAYKGFDLNVFFQGSTGNKIFNAVKHLTMNPAAYKPYNMLEDVKNAWTPENPGSDIPRLAFKDPNNNFGRISDFYIEDGSYVRLKSLTLGYTLPQNLLKGVKPRIYLTAQNLFTITNYSGMDPEVGLNNYGVDTGMYPLSRVYMFGIDFSF
jgi:TonB-linked SusC/RagA family outer membrane protein